MKSRRFFCFLSLLLAPLAMQQAEAAPAQKPNIVLILADDMGWGDLRCHGNEKLDTPALDKLQSQSVELEHFHVSPDSFWPTEHTEGTEL
jgi:hypothetical protein